MNIMEMAALGNGKLSRLVAISLKGDLYERIDDRWVRLVPFEAMPSPDRIQQAKPPPSKADLYFECAVMNEEMALKAKSPEVQRQFMMTSQCWGLLAALEQTDEERKKRVAVP